MSKIYLEISGRGMGKTHRLIQAAVQHVKSGGRAYVHSVTHRGTKRIYEKVAAQLSKEQVSRLSSSGIKKRIPAGARAFWDDIDLFENDPSVIIREGDYYVTTPCRVRSMEDLANPDTKDLLVRLVRFNEGLWTAGTPLCTTLFDKSLADEIKSYGKKAVESEFLAIWLKR